VAEREVPLGGGHLSAVVRVGDTVRRPAGPWTPAVHALLAHLRHRRYSGAPRALGIDERGREILSFIPGHVPSGMPLPACVWTLGTLRRVSALLLGYHRAAAGFAPPPGAVWRTADARPREREIICHNDPAPWNTVFSGGAPQAFIDWDLAGPGRRIWDLAYLVWHFVPLYDEKRCAAAGADVSVETRAFRLAEVCRTYGLPRPGRILGAVIRRQLRARTRIRRLARRGDPAFVRLWQSGVGDAILRDAGFVRRHAPGLGAYLDRPAAGR
jgi:hypothetical protein